MRSDFVLFPVLAAVIAAAGCVPVPTCPQEASLPLIVRCSNGQEAPSEKKDEKEKNGKEDEEKNGKDDDKDEKNGTEKAKTLFEWAIGKKEKNGNGNGNGQPAEDRIQTDRPDFTEASTTVGRGRIQLESGYTFFKDDSGGSRLLAHSYPEMLWRIGMFAEWFELRIGQNFLTETEKTHGVRRTASGADDLYLGVKLGLTEQKGWLPESAIILQMTVPTGAKAFTENLVQPGINLLYGWDIIKDCLSLGASTQINRTVGSPDANFPLDFPDSTSAGHPFFTMAQSLTVNYTLTDRLGAFTEWFAFFPSSATDPAIAPEYYLDGGFTYAVTNNFQLDIRAGVGLNEHADDFFAGTGFGVRY